MRKVYISVGCGECKDLLNFYKEHKDFIYYGIDPSKLYLEIWNNLPMVNFINKAAWVYDGKVSFYQDDHNDPQGSTIIRTKSRGGFKKIGVECIDFSEWLRQFKSDLVYIDMDIEGAEYYVIDKMIKDHTIKFIHKLVYENHAHKFQLNRRKKISIHRMSYALEERLRRLNVNFGHETERLL